MLAQEDKPRRARLGPRVRGRSWDVVWSIELFLVGLAFLGGCLTGILFLSVVVPCCKCDILLAMALMLAVASPGALPFVAAHYLGAGILFPEWLRPCFVPVFRKYGRLRRASAAKNAGKPKDNFWGLAAQMTLLLAIVRWPLFWVWGFRIVTKGFFE